MAAESRLLAPIETAKTILRRGIGAFAAEQERIRLDLERKAQEQARKNEEEMRLALAVQAEDLGATPETTNEILSTPLGTAPRAVSPTYQKVAGVSTSQRWHAEIIDLKALVRAVGEGKASIEFLEANLVALNGLARALKGTMNIPGVRAVAEPTVSARTR